MSILRNIVVDNAAKMRVGMESRDGGYVGGVRFPGALNFQRGLSFMFFGRDDAENEQRVQEMQVGPINPDKRSKSTRLSTPGANRHGDVVIDLHPFLDSFDDMVYVGEAQGWGTIYCDHGAIFRVNPVKEGFGEDVRGELEICGAMRGAELPGLQIPLKRMDRDTHGHPYHVGKIQFPGVINLELGATFRLADDVLHIEMLDERHRFRGRNGGSGVYSKFGKNVIPLQRGYHEYVGEVCSPNILDCTHGYFFTIFTSRPGQEQVQMGRLEHGPRRRRPEAKEDSAPRWGKVG